MLQTTQLFQKLSLRGFDLCPCMSFDVMNVGFLKNGVLCQSVMLRLPAPLAKSQDDEFFLLLWCFPAPCGSSGKIQSRSW
jgi:hypothetical protein